MQVNRLYNANNPLESVPYYSLPFCQPREIYDSPQSLGESIQGDNRQTSLYSLQYRKDMH